MTRGSAASTATPAVMATGICDTNLTVRVTLGRLAVTVRVTLRLLDCIALRRKGRGGGGGSGRAAKAVKRRKAVKRQKRAGVARRSAGGARRRAVLAGGSAGGSGAEAVSAQHA